MILKQFSRLLQNKIFNPMLPYRFLFAKLFLLRRTKVIMVSCASFTGSAYTNHHRAAFAAEQLSEKQIIYFCLSVCSSLLVLVKHFLYLVEQLCV